MNKIVLKNLVKTYNGNKIFNNFNLALDKESTSCIIGVTGSGKTTLLNIMLGLVSPESGEVLGLENERVAVVFQENRLIESLSVYKNLKMISSNKEKINHWLYQFNLEEHKNKPVSQLSGGMKRKLCIARALLTSPSVLILDEALNGLDSESKIEIMKKIKENCKTIIMVSHNDDEINFMADFKFYL